MSQLTLKCCLMVSLIISFLIFPQISSSQWSQQVSGSSNDVYTLYFLNENTGLLGTASPFYNLQNFRGGEIFRTTNGGVNWNNILLDSNFRFKSFYFLDQFTGYAVGGSYTSQGFIFKTTDEGLTWQNITPQNIQAHFYNMHFANPLTGYLSSFNGVYKTTNSGLNWENKLFAPIGFYAYPSIRKIHFFDINTGIYLSDSGYIYKTINSGANWVIINVNPDITFRDIGFINTSTGYAIGLNGKVIKTTNQGSNWQEISFGTTSSLYSIKFTNGLIGYLTKDIGVLKTNDGGNSWQEVLQQGNDTLLSVYFLNPEVGYVGGTKGKVFKTTTGGVIGINQISGEVPTEFLLDQNYPNPFNPTTNIKFAIPKSAFVRLAVYDMLGREVESLVNQQMTPGTYEVNWNALKFSTGIYMYRLVTNDFQMVKKMSLIK